MVRAEVDDAEAAIAELSEQYRLLLLPKDPNDDKNVIVEVRGAEGGEEANLFARDLFDMYRAYAGAHGLGSRCSAASRRTWAGCSEASFLLKGDGVWSRLKHEGGTHRVQRVPVTESQGRIHTSSATVTVLPEAEEIDVEHRPQRPADRRLPLIGPGRAVGQHHRLRRAHHPQADGPGGGHAGREEPAPEPGQGPASSCAPGC